MGQAIGSKRTRMELLVLQARTPIGELGRRTESSSPSPKTFRMASIWFACVKSPLIFGIYVRSANGPQPEHIAIHEGHVGKAQFYMECAQLRISGGGNGTPSPLVKIPGLYSAQDPGIAFNKWGGNVGKL